MFSKMHYVYAVYKEQSFTKAAEKLYISQPYLSATIKRIEAEIGFPLFERKKLNSDFKESTDNFFPSFSQSLNKQ